MALEFVSREGWGARRPQHHPGWGALAGHLPAEVVIMTQSYGRPCADGRECRAAVRQLQGWNMVQQGKQDISCNFVIAGDGRVYEGRGWYNYPDLPYNLKRCPSCLTLGFIGNYSERDLPAKMVEAMVSLIEYGRAFGYIALGHTHHSLLSKLDRPDWRIMAGDPMVVSGSDSEQLELDESDANMPISQLDVVKKTREPKKPWFYPVNPTENKESDQDDYA